MNKEILYKGKIKEGEEFKGKTLEELHYFLKPLVGTGLQSSVSSINPRNMELDWYCLMAYGYTEVGGKLKHASGEGKTKLEARQNYIKVIAGKTLIFHPWDEKLRIGYQIPEKIQ